MGWFLTSPHYHYLNLNSHTGWCLLPTWWHAGRGRMASDPSTNQWKLWFSVTQQCPVPGAYAMWDGKTVRFSVSEMTWVYKYRSEAERARERWPHEVLTAFSDKLATPTMLSGTVAEFGTPRTWLRKEELQLRPIQRYITFYNKKSIN